MADGLPLWNFRMWCGVVGWCAVTNPVGRYRKRSWTGSCVTACGHRPRVSPRAGDSWCWTTRPMSPGSAMSYWDIDTGFTSLLMLLTAVDAGLGACFFVVGPRFTNEPYGLAISKQHPDFVRFVNAVLEQLRSDRQWAASYARWVGTPVPAPPPARYQG